ncbi:acid phosphatase family membrane protein YuiD [Oikeobacillus pervagus]|uniref:Acid phosphatase family membrane protein YuiD n=1 Tax=Oikeobacillus pervagus TaxID=1325931 RepID=A0AAJ1T1V2_9BACI|nr:divergent PAP2 family protein [Oikeobacillus pervagus]MDQ0215257.1 acid phosphatase family membrane protein YuiD [Oikeobacillus pervagus]
MTILYIITPFLAWLIAGTLKFIINYIRFGKEALSLVGNGGFPSTHTTVVASELMLIGFREGFTTPLFGLGLTFLFITIIDAKGIRRTVGKHAETLNEHVFNGKKKLRERQGHNRVEIMGGLGLGILIGYIMSVLS